MSYKAVFLDRDGVINQDYGYVFRPQDLVLLPNIIEGFIKLKQAGFKLVVVTNQSGIARGLFSEEDVRRFHEYLNSKLDPQGKIDAFYYCPFLPDAKMSAYRRDSHDRKPNTGMLERATADLNLNKEQCCLVGDKDSDIECAIRFGIPSYQMTSSYPAHPSISLRYDNFADVVAAILA